MCDFIPSYHKISQSYLDYLTVNTAEATKQTHAEESSGGSNAF